VPLLTITNSGNRTIYNVRGELMTRSGVSLGIPAWEEIPPDSVCLFEGRPDDEMWSKTEPMLDVFASATFTDVGKTHWYRDNENKIHRIEWM